MVIGKIKERVSQREAEGEHHCLMQQLAQRSINTRSTDKEDDDDDDDGCTDVDCRANGGIIMMIK